MALSQLTYAESLLTLVDICRTLLTILPLRSSALLAHCIHEQTILLTNKSTNRLNLITLNKHYTAMDFHLIYAAVITLLSNLLLITHRHRPRTLHSLLSLQFHMCRGFLNLLNGFWLKLASE